jgi:hypothetical protein
MAVTITTESDPDGTRYAYDAALIRNGFAQLDTSEDASWYGNWASAQRRTLVSFVEGDLTTTTCDTIEEFRQEFDRFTQFCERVGYRFLGIDPGLNHTPEILQPWQEAGLAELIH